MWHTKKLMLLFVNVIVSVKLCEQAPLSGLKPGKCPVNAISNNNIGDCSAKTVNLECFLDTNCNGTKKCCRSGCALTCIEPDTPDMAPSVKPKVTSKEPSSPKVRKLGKCPPIPKGIECPNYDPYKAVKMECFYHDDCDKSKLCCLDPCDLKCLNPVPSPTPTPSVYRKEASTKPGQCPRLSIKIQETLECPPSDTLKHECVIDRDCDQDEKCCSDGCSFKCRQPVSITTVKPTTTVDVREASTKPGQCPRLSIKIQETLECPDTLKHECVIDGDCDQEEKCCSDGCSFKCRQPVSITTVKPTTTVDVREPSKKPGKCPRLSIEAIQGIIECPPPYPPIHECIVDRDCDENEKCCSDGCSFKCTQPVSIATVEPTTAVELTVDVREKEWKKCPKILSAEERRKIECSSERHIDCVVHWDCTGGKICCATMDGCDWRCMLPATDSSQKRPAEPKNSRMKTTTDPQTKPTTAPQMKSTTVKQVPMSTGGPVLTN